MSIKTSQPSERLDAHLCTVGAALPGRRGLPPSGIAVAVSLLVEARIPAEERAAYRRLFTARFGHLVVAERSN